MAPETDAMIEFQTGDILRADADALVNTVNCVGIMGRGVALQFKKAFPENFSAYKLACDRGDVQPGRMFVHETGFVDSPKFIINFPTKRHWKGKSRMEDIDAGLRALIEVVKQRGIRSIALPPLGSGLGGLHWPDVKSRIERAARELPDVRFTVFEPRSDSAHVGPTTAAKAPSMTPGRAALVGLVRQYLDGLMDPSITLLEVHKLMYFLQEAGQSLRLRYEKAHYGPYAENLRHVLLAIDGYFVSGYGDGGETPGKELSLVPGAVSESDSFLAAHPDVRERFGRVARLVSGFETPFGLELLATVHWVVKHEGVAAADVEHAVYAWNERKSQFTPRQLRVAYGVLHSQGWLN